MNEPAAPTAWGAFIALLVVIAASGILGAMAQRAVRRGSFLKGYFLGNRGLGAWAMALTATVQSGGTFMGVPSLAYTYGWIVALFIASYMVVPITGFGVLGKRLAQLSRRTGALTVPDLLRARFNSPLLGLLSSLLIVGFLSVMLVAQFKPGAILMKLVWPGSGGLAFLADYDDPPPDALPAPAVAANEVKAPASLDRAYFIGLTVFTVTVVGYTLAGGFLASVWTDLMQSVLMWFGVVLLVGLTFYRLGGLEEANRAAMAATGPALMAGPGHAPPGQQYLPVTLAISFYFVWILGGLGQPASLVRLMAAKDTATLRRSIVLLSAYNAFIYLPLIAVAIAARGIMPELADSDEVVPRMAFWATRGLPGGTLLAGLVLAAPFGAVMATVSSYLVVITSGIVRDVYQQFLHRTADETRIRRLTYAVILLVTCVAVAFSIRPVAYLQALIIFATSCGAASFVMPVMMACYWRRASSASALASMLVGAAIVLTLNAVGFAHEWLGIDAQPFGPTATKFRPYYLWGFDPVMWGLAGSILTGVVVAWFTQPPSQELVSRLFDVERSPQEPPLAAGALA
jgi:SSS family solute:Na+ symporter/sodium/pantothenate symporter